MSIATPGTAPYPVHLPEDFRIAVVEAVAEALCAAIKAPSVRIDGGAVSRVDTAALQLLLAFQRTAEAENVPWEWTAVSGALGEAARLLGVAAALRMALPAALPA